MILSEKPCIYFGLIIWLLAKKSATTVSDFPTFFNIDEINSVLYDVEISEIPILAGEQEDEANLVSVPMVNKHGQKYNCYVPKLFKDKEAGGEDGAGEIAEMETTTETIQKTLAPMWDGPCFWLTKDWWTYEVCYGRAVKQFHLGSDGKPSGSIMVLGYYDRDIEWSEEKNRSNRNDKYHSQMFTNGSKCDLTGNFRQTEVRFKCNPKAKFDDIVQVDEPTSCEYIIVISTAKLCSIPELVSDDDKAPLGIECRPVLSPREFDVYEDLVDERAKMRAERAKKSRQDERESLVSLLSPEDLADIDISTDEGQNLAESLVGRKLADKILTELSAIFGDKPAEPVGGLKVIRIKDVIDEKSGQGQSKLLTTEADRFKGLIDNIAKKRGKQIYEYKPGSKLINGKYVDLDRLDEAVSENVEISGKEIDMAEEEILKEIDNLVDKISSANEKLDYMNNGLKRMGINNDKSKTLEEPESRPSENLNFDGRVVNHAKKAVEEKLTTANLKSRGRRIEVKFIPHDLHRSEIISDSLADTDGKIAEKQYEGLVYNLMIGNQDGYQTIEDQMSTERGYNFNLDKLKEYVIDSLEAEENVEDEGESQE